MCDRSKKPDAEDTYHKLEFIGMSIIDCLQRANESVPCDEYVCGAFKTWHDAMMDLEKILKLD